MRFYGRFQQFRRYSSESRRKFYVTSPIFYVNAAPHIGHLYTAVITDAIARFQRILHPESSVFFCSGTDEHGSKIQQAAEKHGVSTKQYCDQISSHYQRLFKEAEVTPSRFIRTTDEDHKEAVSRFWKRLAERDLIYKTKYGGWYCVPDENFLSEKETRMENGQRVSEESGHPVEWTEEENYMFKLGQLKKEVIRWAEAEGRVQPAVFQKILLDQLLSQDIPDVSISRPKSRVSWGIDVPGDASQTVYVWLDALVNYLTAGESHWPPVHVLGKDILKFHAVYWPAFLIGAGYEPPRQLLVHSHWTVDDQKMSKSRGNVVDPFDRAQVYTMEGMRYFLLREGTAHSDGNYSETKILRILNSELADTFGNLLSRASGRTLNPRQVVPRAGFVFTETEYLRLVELAAELPQKCLRFYQEYNFYRVVDTVIEVLHANNKFFEALKPWELRNDPEKRESIISVTFETLRKCAIILQPVIPRLSDRVLTKLNVTERNWRDLEVSLDTERPLGSESAAVFQRILLPKSPSHETQKRPKKKASQKIQ